MFHRFVRHSTDRCFTLQGRIQDLIDARTIEISTPTLSPLPVKPSFPASPLKPPFDTPPVEPKHHVTPTRQGSQPKQRRGRRIESDYTPLVVPLSIIFPRVAPFPRLPEVRPSPDPLPRWYDVGLYCAYHQATGHATDCCFTLRDVI